MARWTTIGALLLLTAWPSGAAGKLTMRVSPSISQAPSNLIIALVVEPDSENRNLVVAAESADFYRSSTIELPGGRAPRTSAFHYNGVPAGDYHVRAVLVGSRGEIRASAHQSVVVTTGPDR